MGNMGRKLMGFGMAWSERQVFVYVCACVCTCLRGQCVFNVGKVSVWKVCMFLCVCVSAHAQVFIYASAYILLHLQSTSRIVAILYLCTCILGDQLNIMENINRCESYGHLATTSNCSCHSSHTHKSADKCTVIEGRKRTRTQIR